MNTNGTKQGRGRPAKITLAVVESIGEKIALGLTEEMACLLVGINPQSFGPAVCRNPEFRNAIKKAQAKFLLTALNAIAAGGQLIELRDPDGKTRQVTRPWQGLAWILERRHKAQFSRAEISVNGSLSADGIVLTPEVERELSTIANRLYVQPLGEGESRS